MKDGLSGGDSGAEKEGATQGLVGRAFQGRAEQVKRSKAGAEENHRAAPRPCKGCGLGPSWSNQTAEGFAFEATANPPCFACISL